MCDLFLPIVHVAHAAEVYADAATTRVSEASVGKSVS